MSISGSVQAGEFVEVLNARRVSPGRMGDPARLANWRAGEALGRPHVEEALDPGPFSAPEELPAAVFFVNRSYRLPWAYLRFREQDRLTLTLTLC